MQEIAEVIKTLAAQKWEWKAESVRTILRNLNWELIQTVQHRAEYRLPNGWIASVYDDCGGPFLVEVDADVYADADGLSNSQYEDKIDEFYAKYRAAIEAARQVLGDPVFNDGAAATGFPEDQDAVWLAMWRSEDARYMIHQKHEDREMPFRICIVVAPPEC